MTIDIHREEDSRLTVGNVPVRLGGGDHMARYYILTCDHGITELHEVMDITQQDVINRLVNQHHDRTGCSCQPQ